MDWSTLTHAYGSAADIPDLLSKLSVLESQDDLWFDLWSALAHQGDVYDASFAAVPFIVDELSRSPDTARVDYLLFPTWIEICRQRHGIDVQESLCEAYFDALARLPSLVSFVRPWSEDYAVSALAAIAVGKGHADVAERLLEDD